MNANKVVLSASIAAIASIVVANPADALSLTYDFTASGNTLAPLLSFTESGVTVDVTTNQIRDYEVGQNSNGLFTRSSLGRIDLPRDQVDGFDIFGRENEFLQFDFGDTSVKSISVDFRRVGTDIGRTRRIDENDDFGFFVDGSPVFFSEDIPGGNWRDRGAGTYTFDALVPSGSILKFTTPAVGDDYTIAGLTVHVVPTPAAVLPVISGLFAAAGRRKDEETEEA